MKFAVLNLIVVFIMLAFIFVPVVESKFEEFPTTHPKIEEFVTREGVVTATKEVVKINLPDGQSFFICGNLSDELHQLSGVRVRVSGTISKKDEKALTGYYNVLLYKILEEGLTGNIRQSDNGLILVGDDQVIYRIDMPEKMSELTELVNCKVFMRCAKETNADYTGTVQAISEVIFLHKLAPRPIGPYVTLEGDAFMGGSGVRQLFFIVGKSQYILEDLYDAGFLKDAVVTGVWTKKFYPMTKGTIHVEKYSLKTTDPYGTLYVTDDGVVLLGDNQVVYRIQDNPILFENIIADLPTRAVIFAKVEYISEFEANMGIVSLLRPGRFE